MTLYIVSPDEGSVRAEHVKEYIDTHNRMHSLKNTWSNDDTHFTNTSALKVELQFFHELR
jgi:hypothetical protein